MMRFVLLFGLLAAPLAAQTMLEERPGRWISVPPATVLDRAAPAAAVGVSEAPLTGSLIGDTPAPPVILSVPETVRINPPAIPGTRPVPRPRQEVAIAAAAADPEAGERPVGDVADIAHRPAPQPVPEGRPVPRPETGATVALAEALAARIAADAHAIAVAAPRAVPRVETIAPSEALASSRPAQSPAPPILRPEAAVRAPVPVPVPVRVTTPPVVVPALPEVLAPTSLADAPVPMSAVLLPANAATARPSVHPAAFIVPPPEAAPILPRLNPSGPFAMDAITRPVGVQARAMSAALLPTAARQIPVVPRLARAPVPAPDPFPTSALPPSALMPGPESLTRTVQPPRPFAEVNAAVLTGLPPVIPVRMPILLPPDRPAFETPFIDPEASVALPAPDAGAVARMVEDAMICWRIAELSPEAQWARVSVDVALDDTNMPAAQSIRLTGFARVVSSAAEDAYRAAHAALMGCAEATGNAPATAFATLIFDRGGVRLQ